MAATITTIAQLINACPVTVSTAEGVTQAITWFDTVVVFCEKSTVIEIPTKTDIAVRAQSFADATEIGSTDYGPLNNKLMHIKLMLGGVQAVID